MESSCIASKRNFGIDALRILSMFMITILHTLMAGGLFNDLPPMSGQYLTAWFWEICAFCAVNCYALISGYVGIYSKFRYAKVGALWLQIVFYTLLITVIFAFAAPDAVTKRTWLNALLPITSKQYWYLSAYFGMFLCIPIMNLAVSRLRERELRIFLLAVFVLLCTLPSVLGTDPYKLGDGYSMIWLCILYICGGYIRKYDLASRVKKRLLLPVFVLSVLLTWVTQALHGMKPNMPYFRFVSYTSPTIVLTAVCLLLFFARLNFRHKLPTKIISLFAPATLGVYILHMNPLLWSSFVKKLGFSLRINSCLVLTAKMFFIAFCLYLCCSIIDILRVRLFNILHISQRCAALENTIRSRFVRQPETPQYDENVSANQASNHPQE